VSSSYVNSNQESAEGFVESICARCLSHRTLQNGKEVEGRTSMPRTVRGSSTSSTDVWVAVEAAVEGKERE
jgi:hypothetical protein